MSAVTITTTATAIEITVSKSSPAIPDLQAYVKKHFFEYRFGREEITLFPDPKADAAGNQKRKKLLQWLLNSSNLKGDAAGSAKLLMRYKNEFRIRLVTDRPDRFSQSTIHIRGPEEGELVITVENDAGGLVSHFIASVFSRSLLRYDREGRVLHVDCRSETVADPLQRLLEKKSIAGMRVAFRYAEAAIAELTASASPRAEAREIFQDSAYAHIAKLRTSYRLLEVEHNSRDFELIKRQFRKLAYACHPDRADQNNPLLVRHSEGFNAFIMAGVNWATSEPRV